LAQTITSRIAFIINRMQGAALCVAALIALTAASPDEVSSSRRLALNKLKQAPEVNKGAPKMSIDAQKKLCLQKGSMPGLMGRALGCSMMMRSLLKEQNQGSVQQAQKEVDGVEYPPHMYQPPNTGKSIADIFRNSSRVSVDQATLEKYEAKATKQQAAPWHTAKVDKIAVAGVKEGEVPEEATPYKGNAKEANLTKVSGKLAALKEPETEVPDAATPYKAKDDGGAGAEKMGKISKLMPKDEKPLPDEVTPYKAKDTNSTKSVKVPKALEQKETEIPLDVQPYKALG